MKVGDVVKELRQLKGDVKVPPNGVRKTESEEKNLEVLSRGR